MKKVDGRRHWSAERRSGHAAAMQRWNDRMRKNRLFRESGLRVATSPWIDIYTECLYALELRERQLQNVVSSLEALGDEHNDDYNEVIGVAAQHASQVALARQALSSVKSAQHLFWEAAS